jgi:hypothetical protein
MKYKKSDILKHKELPNLYYIFQITKKTYGTIGHSIVKFSRYYMDNYCNIYTDIFTI